MSETVSPKPSVSEKQYLLESKTATHLLRFGCHAELIDELTPWLTSGKQLQLQWSGVDSVFNTVLHDIGTISEIADLTEQGFDATAERIMSHAPYRTAPFFLFLPQLKANATTIAAQYGIEPKTVWQAALREPRLVENAKTFMDKVELIAAEMDQPQTKVARSFVANSEIIVPADGKLLAANFRKSVAEGADKHDHAEACLRAPVYLSFPMHRPR